MLLISTVISISYVPSEHFVSSLSRIVECSLCICTDKSSPTCLFVFGVLRNAKVVAPGVVGVKRETFE